MEKEVSTLRELYLDSTRKYANEKLFWQTDGVQSYTYASFKEACDSLSARLEEAGVGFGDKVAIFSQSMPNWSLAMFATVAFGRIAVPLLPDFTESEVTNVLTHSESTVLFVSRKLIKKVSEECLSRMDLVIDIESLEVIRKSDNVRSKGESLRDPAPEDIATIIYTSGTTGSAKGVVLSHLNIYTNLIIGIHYFKIGPGDILLSVLPMAHTYELSLGMFYPYYCGAAVCYMSKLPTPTILLKTMNEVRPTAILTVPLIIEKVYKSSIVPLINKSKALGWMYKHMNGITCRIIGKKLIKTFGGKLRFYGIGGAKLDPDIESFLKKAHFPYFIGYGLTECAPLLILSKWFSTVPGSIGFPGHGVQIRLDNVNPETGQGEIVAKGNNIMIGYYKDPERTKAAFTEDGWFKTNDLASVDKEGRYFIKGRLNNMILGASGENIYPEEIEKVINDYEGVNESIVLERSGKLLALVNFNEDVLNWNLKGEDEFVRIIEEHKAALVKFVNSKVNKASNISEIGIMKEPFEKTATKKIRRFLYKDTNPDA
ncbi:MAG: AMP-binding protein [Bacteroidaceae bacterium]|nr:AMP-binding protein [Bacteroidaceae bacterium]